MSCHAPFRRHGELKAVNISLPLLVRIFHLEVRGETDQEETTKSLGLTPAKTAMILSHCGTTPVCDRQTDRFTIASTAFCCNCADTL